VTIERFIIMLNLKVIAAEPAKYNRDVVLVFKGEYNRDELCVFSLGIV